MVQMAVTDNAVRQRPTLKRNNIVSSLLASPRVSVNGLLMLLATASPIGSQLHAQPAPRSATASVNVIRPLSVAVNKTLNFGRLQVRGGKTRVIYATIDPTQPLSPLKTSGLVVLAGGGETPLEARIIGDPLRTYRISIPQTVLSTPGRFTVSNFVIVSATRNNARMTGSGVLGNDGTELIRIGATLTLNATASQAVYKAIVPITVVYE